MSLKICDDTLCTGCSLCADACPHGAVKIAPDEYGFARPAIDGALCAECMRCVSVCPVNSPVRGDALSVYAAYAKDKDIRRASSSGGMFRLLADSVIDAGGAVAAVGYDKDFRAVYKIAKDKGSLGELMGSKYTEASSDGIYKKVKDELAAGRRVLFVGTPCRVAALKNFTGDPEGLLTVDFICHGVPTPALLERFLAGFGKVTDVSFRDKSRGWQEFSMRVDTEDGSYAKSLYKDPYLRTFLGNASLREACYDCRFKGDSYAADITLGDYWGISSHIPSMNDDRGTSAVVIRTGKGRAAFDAVMPLTVSRPSSKEALSSANVALVKCAKRPATRERFLAMIKDGEPFDAIAAEFGRPLPAKMILTERSKRAVKKILGKIKK